MMGVPSSILGSDTGVMSASRWGDHCDQAGSQFGAAVGTAGDVNGDGYSDIIVGAPLWNHGDINEGGAFVYHGSRSGLATTPPGKRRRHTPRAVRLCGGDRRRHRWGRLQPT